MGESMLLLRIRQLEELVAALTKENEELKRRLLNVWGEA